MVELSALHGLRRIADVKHGSIADIEEAHILTMPPLELFGISIAFSFIAWGIVVARYLWPELGRQSRADALRPLLVLHCFRFIGGSWCSAWSRRTWRLPRHTPLPTVISLLRC
jgi:hypothetical protein